MAPQAGASTRLRWQSRELLQLRPALEDRYARVSDAELWAALDEVLRATKSPLEVESFWNQVGNVLSGAASGAVPGAAMGAVGGPYGALIGAGLGAVTGGINAATGRQPARPRSPAPARPQPPPSAPTPPPSAPMTSGPAPVTEPVSGVVVGSPSPSPSPSASPAASAPAQGPALPATSNLLDPQLLAALAQTLLPVLLQQLGRRDGVALGRRGLRVHPLAALDALRVLVDRARLEAEAVLGRDAGQDSYLRNVLGDFVGEPSQPEARAARVLELAFEEEELRALSLGAPDIITPLPKSPSNVTRFRRGVANTRAFPHSAICQLRMQMSAGGSSDWFVGTGFYVAEGLILTAGHNVHHARYGRATRMLVTPGRQSLLVRPFASFEITPTQMHAHARWSGSLAGADFDLAVLTVGTTPPEGRFLELLEERLREEQVLTVCGYAASEEDGVDPNEQNLDQDFVRVRTANTLTYSLNTTGGSSGSPAYAEVGGRICAVGVHSRSHDPRTNMGCRLTSDKLQWIRSLAASAPDRAESRSYLDPQVLHSLDRDEPAVDPLALDQRDPLGALFELQQGHALADELGFIHGVQA